MDRFAVHFFCAEQSPKELFRREVRYVCDSLNL